MSPPPVSPVATSTHVAMQAVSPGNAPALTPVADGAAPMAEAGADAAAPVAEELGRAIGELTEVLRTTSIGLRFEIDDVTRRVVTKVIDKETGDLIRQIPTEEVLRFARALDKLQGVFVRQTA